MLMSAMQAMIGKLTQIIGEVRTAADNLTPVTLELGGKSPALVTRHYSVEDAATRIAPSRSRRRTSSTT